MRWMRVVAFLLIVWVIFAQSCMTFRVTDEEAKEKFAAKGIPLQTSSMLVNKFPIHYVVAGSDTMPTLIFVHGTPGSWDAFENYLADSSLLRHYRMVSIDRPGFGYSNFGQSLHLAAQSELISPLFHVLDNHRPMWLVGHSLGGPMILKLALDNPKVFRGAVVIAGSTDPDEEKPEKWRPYLFKTPLNFFVPGAFRPSNRELWYLKHDLVLLRSELPKVDCPVYFIHGRKDDWVPPGNVAYTKSQLNPAIATHELWFDDGTHFIPWSKFPQIRDYLIHLQ